VKHLLIAVLLFPSIALADPSDADKAMALRAAYELNGHSMVRMGAVDMTLIEPAPEPEPIGIWPKLEKPKAEKRVRTAEANICTRHGKRKIMRNHGKSWRCSR
jgi:hypothetical protein